MKLQRIINLARYAWLNRSVRFVLVPAVLYFTFFSFYTWPWMANFGTHYFSDQVDGLQNIWNVWWTNKSIAGLGQSPWFTVWQHFPHGTSVVPHTFNIVNGLLAVPFLFVLDLHIVFNGLVVFSFVASGLTMLWLCYYFTKKYWASFIGGFVYTFSSYHFAHAHGQMQLTTMQWVPLFLLVWWMFLRRPTYNLAIASVLTLLLVLMTDYYYFLFTVLLAGAIYVYLAHKKRTNLLDNKKVRTPVLLFLVSLVAFLAWLPLQLFLLSRNETLLGSHSATIFSTDLFAPFINGGFWRFSELTQFYWGTVRAWYVDSTVYLGASVLILLAIAVIKRKRVHADTVFWLGVAGLAYVFSLGPRLVVSGRVFDSIPLPYALIEAVIPMARLSGTPVRIMFVVVLASSIVSAMVLAKIRLTSRWRYACLLGLFLIMFIDVWPSRMPMQHKNDYPGYVTRLQELPGGNDVGVLDTAAETSRKMTFYQTIHEKPVANTFLNQMPLARTPGSVLSKDMALLDTALDGELGKLCSEYKIRYIVTRDTPQQLNLENTLVYQGSDAKIYDLSKHEACIDMYDNDARPD